MQFFITFIKGLNAKDVIHAMAVWQQIVESVVTAETKRSSEVKEKRNSVV